MVRKLLTLLVLFFALNANAQNFGAGFIAKLSRENIAEGDKFQIILELRNAESYSPPDISKFPESIKILSQSQAQNFAYINGSSTKVRSWIYDVTAERSGDLVIPKISIQTESGMLYSDPISLHVKQTSDIPSVSDTKDIFIDAKVDKLSPYIDEPIIYQTKVYHLAEIDSAELVKPKSEGAVIEQISEPKTGTKNLNGAEYNTIEVNYLVTPVKSGKVVISPSILRGKSYKEVDEKGNSNGGAQFDDFFDPFSLINGDSKKTKKLVPFTVASNTVDLDVKPADESVSPWLALYDFNISTESDINNPGFVAKLGEPITMKITLTGIGKSGDLLPDIEKFIHTDDFKVYADKPVSSRQTLSSGNSFAEKIKGIKSQNFTFIPQKAGKLKFPQVEIKYWNLKDAKAEKASTEAREFYVTSDPSKPLSEQVNKDVQNKQGKEPDQNSQTSAGNGNERVGKIFTVVVGILLFFIIGLLFRLKSLKSQIILKPKKPAEAKIVEESVTSEIEKEVEGDQLLKQDTQKTVKRTITKKISDDFAVVAKPAQNYSFSNKIKESKDEKDILKVLQDFAYRNLNLQKNMAAVLIAQNMQRQYPIEKHNIVKLAAEIDSAIYANKQIDINELKNSFAAYFEILQHKIKEQSKKKHEVLPKLNPE